MAARSRDDFFVINEFFFVINEFEADSDHSVHQPAVDSANVLGSVAHSEVPIQHTRRGRRYQLVIGVNCAVALSASAPAAGLVTIGSTRPGRTG